MQEFLEILKGLLTPVIGVIAVYIAYQQHKTNRQRELRESRKSKLDVYKKIKRFINEVNYSGAVTDSAYDEICEAVAEADFLFSDDITEWLSELQSIAAEWRSQEEGILIHLKETGKSRMEFDSEQSGKPEYDRLLKDMESYIDQIQMAELGIKKRFSKYLELR